MARQVSLVQGPQEEAEAHRAQQGRRRAAEQAAEGRRRRRGGRRRENGVDDEGGDRFHPAPGGRAREVQFVLRRERRRVYHQIEGKDLRIDSCFRSFLCGIVTVYEVDRSVWLLRKRNKKYAYKSTAFCDFCDVKFPFSFVFSGNKQKIRAL